MIATSAELRKQTSLLVSGIEQHYAKLEQKVTLSSDELSARQEVLTALIQSHAADIINKLVSSADATTRVAESVEAQIQRVEAELRRVILVMTEALQTNLLDAVIGNREIAESLTQRTISEIGAQLQSAMAVLREQGLQTQTAAGLGFTRADSENLFTERRTFNSVSNGKIAIFGIQKSGNTWVHSLIADTFDLPYLFDLNDVDSVGVLNTHAPCDERIWSRNDIVHSVCLVRDIRAVVVSYFHYMQSSGYQKDIPYADYSDMETFYYDFFLSRVVPALRAHTYCEEYASHGVPILRYERLVNDTKHEMQRLFRRWSIPYDEGALDRAISNNSFDRLKSEGKKMGDVFIEQSHFRSGGKSDFRRELPDSILKDMNRRFESTLLRWGYEL